jgi:hypothetical protein
MSFHWYMTTKWHGCRYAWQVTHMYKLEPTIKIDGLTRFNYFS